MDQPHPDTGPEPASDEPPELPEALREYHPRIYLASLSDYNAGRLHGAWIDAAQDDEEIWEELNAMLASSPGPMAEEFAIHDYDGFGPLRLGEYERIEDVARIGRGIAEHGHAYAAWAQSLGSSREQLGRFEDCYLGEWESLTDYAQQLLDDLGIDTDALGPDWLAPYIHLDIEAFARDLASDVTIVDTNHHVYVFEP